MAAVVALQSSGRRVRRPHRRTGQIGVRAGVVVLFLISVCEVAEQINRLRSVQKICKKFVVVFFKIEILHK